MRVRLMTEGGGHAHGPHGPNGPNGSNGPSTSASASASSSSSGGSVFVTTEDPTALEAFRHASPPGWKIYTYAPATANVTYTNKRSPMADARESEGSAGLHSIVALVLSMEAVGYVLTTNSNWSRMIDELRQARRRPVDSTILTDLSRPLGTEYTNW